jgi:hypothetical protein
LGEEEYEQRKKERIFVQAFNKYLDELTVSE